MRYLTDYLGHEDLAALSVKNYRFSHSANPSKRT